MKSIFLICSCLSLLLTKCKLQVQNINIETFQKQLPVLINKEANEILKIRVTKYDGFPLTVEKLKISTVGTTDLNDLESISVFYTADKERFSTESIFAKSSSLLDEMIFEGKQTIEKDTNYFWLSYKLKKSANLLNSVDGNCTSIITNSGEVQVALGSTTTNIVQQLGVAVRQNKQDNVHTYRIPGLTTTNKGTLLATYDVRREMGRDLQGNIDIGLSRSLDGGQNWESMQIVLDMKTWGGLPEKFNGVSDANILVDRTNNDIYITGLWMHGVINSKGKWLDGLNENSKDWNHQWKTKGSQPGLGVKQTCQFLITKSTDDGKTWSEPVNLTEICKDPKWWLWAPAPGHGITLKDGTILFPTQGRDENGKTFSNITYSKDHGITWKTSKVAYQNTTECMAVELLDGSILLNMRDNRNHKEKGEKNGRAITMTYDLGKTWTEHPTSHAALIESVCMASIHRHNYKDKKGEAKSILLFSNPNSKFKRHKQTIKVSFDDGSTWPEKYWLELDAGIGRGYSCLTSVDENTIGILYEGSQSQMTFQKILLSEFLN